MDTVGLKVILMSTNANGQPNVEFIPNATVWSCDSNMTGHNKVNNLNLYTSLNAEIPVATFSAGSWIGVKAVS